MPQETAKWKGASGRTYEHQVFEIGTNFNDVPGNYLYAKIMQGYWTALYIGQTSSLRDRLPAHEALPCVRRHGATHVHAHLNRQGEQARVAEEEDLLLQHQPVCNTRKKAAE